MASNARRIATLGLVLAAIGGGLAAWRGVMDDEAPGVALASGETLVTLTVDKEQISVAADRLRFADQRRSGSYPRVELELKWPGLTPVGLDDPAAKTTARDGRLVFMTIEPRETDLDTADRIATIYQKFLQPDAIQSTDTSGLMRQAFLAGSAYDGEALYFEPGSVHPFAARCYAESKGEPPISCLRDVRLGKHLIATIRFPIAALAEWRQLRDKTDAMFAEMTGGGSG